MCCLGSTGGIVPQSAAENFSTLGEAINTPNIFGDHHLQEMSLIFRVPNPAFPRGSLITRSITKPLIF